jgi:hypothetical protein
MRPSLIGDDNINIDFREARFEALTVVMFQIEVFWDVMPCTVVVVYHRFRDHCYHIHNTRNNPEDLDLISEKLGVMVRTEFRWFRMASNS